MTPEERKEILMKADVYALGILISTILTCKYDYMVYKDNDKLKVNANNVLFLNDLHVVGLSHERRVSF